MPYLKPDQKRRLGILFIFVWTSEISLNTKKDHCQIYCQQKKKKKKISEISLKSKLVQNENFLQTEISDDISSKKCYLIKNRK